MNQGSIGTGLKQFYGGGNNGRYDNIDKIRVDNVTKNRYIILTKS